MHVGVAHRLGQRDEPFFFGLQTHPVQITLFIARSQPIHAAGSPPAAPISARVTITFFQDASFNPRAGKKNFTLLFFFSFFGI
jgi:hypothetical protein